MGDIKRVVIRDVWLRKEGTDIVVLVRFANQDEYTEIIREKHSAEDDAEFSHNVSALGMARSR